MLAERMTAHGVEAVVSYKRHEDTKYGSLQTFLIKKLMQK
jgi:hypothetical protein